MLTEETLKNTILRATVGSHLFGLNTPESDVDEMGICIETPQRLLGFKKFEQDEDSERDITIYGLRKFLALALNGNPTIVALLFAPEAMCSVRTFLGAQVQELAPRIISRKAGHAFLGYLRAQRKRLNGEQGGKDVNRPELVEKYGYDTKYAMHMLRLGCQGVELLKTGKLSLPMKPHNRGFLMDVRNGKVKLEQCLEEAAYTESLLEDLIKTSTLQEEPQYEYVEKWLVTTYLDTWR